MTKILLLEFIAQDLKAQDFIAQDLKTVACISLCNPINGKDVCLGLALIEMQAFGRFRLLEATATACETTN